MLARYIAAAIWVYICLAVPIAAHAAPSGGDNCAALNATAGKAVATYNANTGKILMNSYHDPGPLGIQACIKSLLDFGTSIGLPTINIGSILNVLSNAACAAAKSAENKALNDLNHVLPTGPLGSHARVHRGGGNQIYKTHPAQSEAQGIFGALN